MCFSFVFAFSILPFHLRNVPETISGLKTQFSLGHFQFCHFTSGMHQKLSHNIFWGGGECPQTPPSCCAMRASLLAWPNIFCFLRLWVMKQQQLEQLLFLRHFTSISTPFSNLSMYRMCTCCFRQENACKQDGGYTFCEVNSNLLNYS